ncbi:MAG: tetratricopeptide repeat protein [Candidatus Heimdallarchaeota archaeon]|nr:tetratricopeptide repeat protein [Candidatus Heimdallarchaeota archaeon]
MREQQIQDIAKFLEEVQKFYHEGDLKKAIELLEKGEPVIHAENFDEYLKIQFYLLYSEILVVSILMENKDFGLATEKLQICDKIILDSQSLESARLNIQYAIAWDYKPISNPEEKIENLNIAIDYIIKAIEILEVVKNTKYLSMAYFYRGLFFERWDQLEEASIWYNNSYQLAKNTNNPIEMSFAGRHLGFLEIRKGELENAEKFLVESLKLRDDVGFKIGVPFSILSLGDLHARNKDYQKAMEFYKSGYEAALKIGLKMAMAIGYISIGRTFIRLEQFNESVPYLEKGIELAEKVNNQELASLARKTLETKSVG